jgi:hypothetical protein
VCLSKEEQRGKCNGIRYRDVGSGRQDEQIKVAGRIMKYLTILLLITIGTIASLSGCAGKGFGRLHEAPDATSPQFHWVSLNDMSHTGVRRWRVDEATLAPSPEWKRQDGSRDRCTAVFLTSDDFEEVSIECEMDSPVGFIGVQYETASILSFGSSDVVPMDRQVRKYSILFRHATFLRVGKGEGDLVFSFGSERQGPFSEFARIPLRIYTLLGTPSLPWAASPDSDDNPHAPWLKALDVAVLWAQGARTCHEAASLITHAVFALGLPGEQGRLKWDGGLSHFCTTYALLPGRNAFTVDRFFLSDFLEMLEHKEGAPQLVNCSDVAAVVYVFSNLLGCKLSMMTLGVDRARTNEVSFNLRPVCPLGSRGAMEGIALSMHQVAWLGSHDSRGMVYDACLALSEEGRWAPACGLRFGDASDRDSYIARLTAHPPVVLLRSIEQCSIAPLRFLNFSLSPMKRQ